MFEVTLTRNELLETLTAVHVAIELSERRLIGWRNDPEMVALFTDERDALKSVYEKLETTFMN